MEEFGSFALHEKIRKDLQEKARTVAAEIAGRSDRATDERIVTGTYQDIQWRIHHRSDTPRIEFELQDRKEGKKATYYIGKEKTLRSETNEFGVPTGQPFQLESEQLQRLVDILDAINQVPPESSV